MEKETTGRQHIPDKVYFRIGEVSALVGVAPHVLRYWESEFTLVKPRRAASNQRLYRRKDVEALLLIRELLHNRGYTIAGARKFFDRRDFDLQEFLQNHSDTDENKATEKLADIKEELRRIQQLLALKSLRY